MGCVKGIKAHGYACEALHARIRHRLVQYIKATCIPSSGAAVGGEGASWRGLEWQQASKQSSDGRWLRARVHLSQPSEAHGRNFWTKLGYIK